MLPVGGVNVFPGRKARHVRTPPNRRKHWWLMTYATAMVPAFSRQESDERERLIGMTGSLQLCDYPADIVRLSCAKCGRAGHDRAAV